MSKESDNITETPVEDERRQLLRIEDTAIIELRPLPNVVQLRADQHQTVSQETWAECVDDNEDRLFYLMRELQNIDMESQRSFVNLQQHAPDLAVCLDAINRKINSIGETLCDDMFESNDDLQAIDLSTGGIGFNHDERLLEDSHHRLKLWFDKSHVGVCANIKVIACNPSITGGHHISAMFSAIGDTDLQIIRRHIAQAEAQMRRDAAAIRSVMDSDSEEAN